MTEHHPTGKSNVGYGRPPKHTQFQEGCSGNPLGRPKKSTEEFKEVVLRSIAKKAGSTGDGKRQHLSKFELGLNNLADRAVQGNRLAWRELMDTMERFGIKLTQGPNSGLTFIIEDGPSNDQVTREQGKRRGRRKELPNYGNILLQMLNKKVVSIVDGKRRRISKFELCLDNLAAQVALGDRLAWRELMSTMDRFGVKLPKSGGLRFVIREAPKTPALGRPSTNCS
jgi:hypothetical protein